MEMVLILACWFSETTPMIQDMVFERQFDVVFDSMTIIFTEFRAQMWWHFSGTAQ